MAHEDADRTDKTASQIAAQISRLTHHLVARALERNKASGRRNTADLIIASTPWEDFVSTSTRVDPTADDIPARTTWSAEVGRLGTVYLNEKHLRTAASLPEGVPAMETVEIEVSPTWQLALSRHSRLNPILSGNVYAPYEHNDLTDEQTTQAAARILLHVLASVDTIEVPTE